MRRVVPGRPGRYFAGHSTFRDYYWPVSTKRAQVHAVPRDALVLQIVAVRCGPVPLCAVHWILLQPAILARSIVWLCCVFVPEARRPLVAESAPQSVVRLSIDWLQQRSG